MAALIIIAVTLGIAAFTYYGGLGVYARSGSRMYALLLVAGCFSPAAIICLPILGFHIPDGWAARHGRRVHYHVSHGGTYTETTETAGPLDRFRAGFDATYKH